MKKIILAAALFMVLSGVAGAQTKTTVTKDGKTFTATRQASSDDGKGYKPSGFQYIDTDGKAYEIYTHTIQKGENAGKTICCIRKVSKKTGKPYWKRIDVKPEELEED